MNSAEQKSIEQAVDPGPEREYAFVSKDAPWNAQWIWLNNNVFPERLKSRRTAFCEETFPYTLALFRRTFVLSSKPKKATAWLSADTRYVCRINGKFACRGPAEAGGDFRNTESPQWWFYDGLEVTEHLEEGLNVIAVEVVLGPVALADTSMGRGGLLCEISVEHAGGETLLSTDESWRGAVCPAAHSQKEYDARQEPENWTEPGFDDSSWPPATVLGPVNRCRWNLLPREIPALAEISLEAIDVKPLDTSAAASGSLRNIILSGKTAVISPGTDRTFRLSFEKEVAGYLFLDVEGPAGLGLTVIFREKEEGGFPLKEQFILPGRRWRHCTRHLRGFQFLDVTVSFPEKKTAQDVLLIHSIKAVFSSFPLRNRGSFECSDSLLNNIHSAARWTDRLCMQACHLDSPIHQEPPGDTGDYLIEALISYYCFGETRLARKDILRIAHLLEQKKGVMFTTSYSLLWIWMLHDYWMYSADADTVGRTMNQAHLLMDLFESYRGATGLVSEAPNYMFVDWTEAGRYNLHHPPASMGMGPLSAFLHRALVHAAGLADLCGETSKAQEYRQRAAQLRDRFNSLLWDKKRGLYRDGIPGETRVSPSKWLPADPREPTFSAHTNILAVAAGIADRKSARNIMLEIMKDSRMPVVQPYFMHYFFEALHLAGMFEEYGVSRIREWSKLIEEHPGSLKERWDSGDYSHAWSGSPAYQMYARILGVTPARPGFREIAVSPCPAGLKWVRGTVPMPSGALHLAWKTQGETLQGRLRGPEGRTVQLHTPGASSVEISLDSKTTDTQTSGPDRVFWTLSRGEYQIEIRQ